MNVKLIIHEAFRKFLSLPGGAGGGSDPKVIKLNFQFPYKCEKEETFIHSLNVY